MAHRAYTKQYLKKYVEKNKDTLREKQRAHRTKYLRERYNTNPTYRTAKRLRTLFYFALTHYTRTGKILKSKQAGINYSAIIKHLMPFPPDIHKYHIDHIKPLSKFDLNDPEQIKEAFAPENHQWLLAKENQSKGNR